MSLHQCTFFNSFNWNFQYKLHVVSTPFTGWKTLWKLIGRLHRQLHLFRDLSSIFCKYSSVSLMSNAPFSCSFVCPRCQPSPSYRSVQKHAQFRKMQSSTCFSFKELLDQFKKSCLSYADLLSVSGMSSVVLQPSKIVSFSQHNNKIVI